MFKITTLQHASNGQIQRFWMGNRTTYKYIYKIEPVSSWIRSINAQHWFVLGVVCAVRNVHTQIVMKCVHHSMKPLPSTLHLCSQVFGKQPASQKEDSNKHRGRILRVNLFIKNSTACKSVFNHLGPTISCTSKYHINQ